jgi:hypothetical protein
MTRYTMAAAHSIAGVPQPMIPPVAPTVVVPPLTFPGDPGTSTGWLVDQSTPVTSSLLVRDVEAGLTRLSINILAQPGDPGYTEVMIDLMDEVINSTDLCCYLTVSGTSTAIVRVMLVHFIGKYSDGLSSKDYWRGLTSASAGSCCYGGPNLATSFTLREASVPTEAKLVAYYMSAGAGNLLYPLAMAAINTVHLAPLCLIPHAWAAYFLDSKTPFEAFKMGTNLIATLDTADKRDLALPLANWLQVAYVKCGLAVGGHHFSCLDTSWAPIAPHARVIWWASTQLTSYPKSVVLPLPCLE